MLLFVKMLRGKNLHLDVEENDTIATLKVKIEDKEGIPPARQLLLYACQPLLDAATLEDYNIREEAILHLIVQ